MSDHNSFGQASRSAAKQPRRCSGLGCFQVIESQPILFAKGHQLSPGPHVMWYGLAQVVEYPHVVWWNTSLFGGFKKRF